jgi:hypothetical protein
VITAALNTILERKERTVSLIIFDDHCNDSQKSFTNNHEVRSPIFPGHLHEIAWVPALNRMTAIPQKTCCIVS